MTLLYIRLTSRVIPEFPLLLLFGHTEGACINGDVSLYASSRCDFRLKIHHRIMVLATFKMSFCISGGDKGE
jgi:hypothetical protein